LRGVSGCLGVCLSVFYLSLSLSLSLSNSLSLSLLVSFQFSFQLSFWVCPFRVEFSTFAGDDIFEIVPHLKATSSTSSSKVEAKPIEDQKGVVRGSGLFSISAKSL
jgi:hypothetical protein